ncbi:hypothetical protein [Herbaspirillum sp.]|uniref:hypothetical protein n=2 Tax=Herbaspirillum sp. TaxID=1890675 RepID=UPI00258B4743|nr:hypothetical protein [Herbaspirillum sp.]
MAYMKKRQTYSTILERGGKVSWPKASTDWKIGQRVFLSIHDGAIVVTTRPSRLMKGRIFSTRISRKFSSKNFAAT